eukprot:10223752-Lingulodinium_polyedra.AAC.1
MKHRGEPLDEDLVTGAGRDPFAPHIAQEIGARARARHRRRRRRAPAGPGPTCRPSLACKAQHAVL